MNITKVTVEKVSEEERVTKRLSKNLLCRASIVLDYNICINDIDLLDGNGGKYIVFPRNNKQIGICYPTSNELRLKILDKIIEEYEK